MQDTPLGFSRTMEGVTFAQARERIEAAFKKEGFGVLTEIDVRATMKNKLDVEFPNYVILGTCNPPLAHRALTTDPGIGLLLPCNVVVTEDGDGNAVVAVMDPALMTKVLPNASALEGPMGQAREKVRRALENA